MFKKFIDLNKLKSIVRKKKILTAKQYNSFYSQLALKDNIPAIPNRSYKNKGWISWSDFLGTKNKPGGKTKSQSKKRPSGHNLNS